MEQDDKGVINPAVRAAFLPGKKLAKPYLTNPFEAGSSQRYGYEYI